MECELIRRKDRSELAPTCTAPGETMRAGPWEGLSAVSFGIVLHLFSASIFSQKVFRGSKITRVFLQPFCNREVGNPTGAWQAGRHRRAHGEDIRLKSSASASEWHEYRDPRKPLTLRDVSASLAGLGTRSRVSRHRVPALASHARTFWRCISVDRH